MSLDLASLGSMTVPIPTVDMSSSTDPHTNAMRIKQVSKAMEQVFASQLMSELGKGVDGTDKDAGGDYSDFIQQAMGQGVTAGGGLGLAKMIEQSLTRPAHVQSNAEVSQEAAQIHHNVLHANAAYAHALKSK